MTAGPPVQVGTARQHEDTSFVQLAARDALEHREGSLGEPLEIGGFEDACLFKSQPLPLRSDDCVSYLEHLTDFS